MKALGFDAGYNFAYGLVDLDGPVSSGTIKVPGSVRAFGISTVAVRDHALALMKRFKPDGVIMAEPWVRRHPPTTADSLRPIFGFTAIVEMVAQDLNIPFFEENEPRVRGYFLPGVGWNTEHIKSAAVQACEDRCWAVVDHHSADALLMAAYLIAVKVPDRQHELLPLYQKRRRASA